MSPRRFHLGRTGSGRSDGRRQALVLGVLAVLVLGVTGAALWSIYHSSPASAGVARTVTVQRGVVQESVSASGNISPVSSASVNFTTGGTVTSVRVSPGQHVTAGEVLATVDPSQAEANLQSAEASLEAAQSTLTADEQGGTSSQLQQDAVSLAQQQSQLTADEQTLSSDQTTLDQAEQQLSADEALGCPPASSTDAGGSSSTGSGADTGTGSGSGTGSSGSGSGGSGSGGSGSGGSGGTAAVEQASAVDVPVATTGSATSVMTTTAQLNGTVEAGGAAASFYFQYGETTDYGHTTGWESAGGSSVSADLTGLSPDTTYIYRLVAADSAGTAYGSPAYFTTSQSSCVTDQEAVTTDQQTVQRQQSTVSQQESSISATEAAQAVQPATVAQAQAQVAEAQLTVTEDEKAVAGTTLRAPIAGTVTAVSGTVGETVSAGTTSTTSGTSGSSGTGSSGSGSGLGSSSSSSNSSSSASSAFVTIQSLGSLEVVVGFPEADATNIAVGQPATVTLSALPDTEVGGKVIAVSDVSTVVSNVVTYDETIALDNPPSTVKDGMTALVSVIVATASDVLEVPSAAITTTGAISTVSVKKGSSTQVVRVTLGLVGNSSTEILSGVTAGETLVEPTASVSSSTGTSSSSTGGRTGFLGGGGGGGGGFFPGG